MVTLSQINFVKDCWAEQELKNCDIDSDQGNEHEESVQIGTEESQDE